MEAIRARSAAAAFSRRLNLTLTGAFSFRKKVGRAGRKDARPMLMSDAEGRKAAHVACSYCSQTETKQKNRLNKELQAVLFDL